MKKSVEENLLTQGSGDIKNAGKHENLHSAQHLSVSGSKNNDVTEEISESNKEKKMVDSGEITKNKYDELLEEDTLSSEFIIKETIDLKDVSPLAGPKNRSVTITKRSTSKVETAAEDDDEFIWIEEEVVEEVEVETDEETIDEEDIEEESEGEEVDLLNKIEDEKFGEEIEDEVKEEQELEEEEEFEEVPEDLQIEEEKQIKESETEVEEVLEEGMIGEELEEEAEVEEEERVVEEKAEEEEVEEEDIKEILEEHEEGMEKEEVEEEEMEEEEEEEEEGELEVGIPKKSKKKFIKIIKMVRKRKRDVLLQLQKKAELVDKDYEQFKEREEKTEVLRKQLEEEFRLKEEAAKKENEETIKVIKGLANELIFLKKKNKMLSRGIIDYFRTRRDENIQEVDPPSSEVLNRYHKRLKLFNDLRKAVNNEIVRLNYEMNDIQQDLNNVVNGYEEEKNGLLAWITETGKDVIKTQTGKPLEESVCQHLVQRCEVVMNQIARERLTLISLTNKLTENEAELKKLVSFEGTLSLIDYEQLRMDNQSFSEKIEERDNELAHLRKRVLEIIHTNAHVLEKTDAITEDIERYNNQDIKLNKEISVIRRKVTKLKTTRDHLRCETSKMRKEAGLLTRPKIALDFEQSEFKISETRKKMETLVKTFKKQKLTIENLRKEITDATAFYDLF